MDFEGPQRRRREAVAADQRRAEECRKRVIYYGGTMANLSDPKDLGLLLYLADQTHWPQGMYKREGESYEQAEARWHTEEPDHIARCVQRAQQILQRCPPISPSPS